MPLPRFEKLSDSKKESILSAAAREFAERGFKAASYNRIIDLAGISKGAMYYYFADKDDLYRTVLDGALSSWLGRMDLAPDIDSPESYWRACEAIYARVLRFFFAEPQSAALCWSIAQARERGESHPAQIELGRRLETWTVEIIRIGQRVGAVRTDMPNDLMRYLAIAMLEAMDRWLAAQWDQLTPGHVDDTAHMLIAIMRRVAAPSHGT